MSITSIIRYLALVVGSIGTLGQGMPAVAQTAYDGFNPPTISGYAKSVAVQSDGKILIGGFTTLTTPWGQVQNIARLFPDGSHDPGFDAHFSSNGEILDLTPRADGSVLVAGRYSVGSGGGMVALLDPDGSTRFLRAGLTNGDVTRIAELADGKLLIVGAFTTVDGQPRPGIARLGADGSLDETYAPSSGANAAITQLLIQPDGRAIVAGDFTLVGDQPRVGIARLNVDGSLDADFDLPTGVNDRISSLALQPDGKVLIGGAFTAAGHAARHRIARVNADGSLDAGFQSGAGPNGTVNDIALQPDGSLLIAGNFLAVDGRPRTRVARLHHDGVLDDRFPPNSTAGAEALRSPTGVNAPITGLALQVDGKALLVGLFSEVDGKPRSGIARLNADGSLDANLEVGPQTAILAWNESSGPGTLNATTIQPDGKLLIGGQFERSYDVPRKGIVRFNADGSLDLGFDPGAGPSWPLAGDQDGFSVNNVVLQPDQKILVGGVFTLFGDVPSPGLTRLNRDGSLDASFSLPPLYASDAPIPTINSLVVQPDGKVLAAGTIQTEANGGLRKILRFLPDGSLDPTFNPYDFSSTNRWPNSVVGLQLQNDGRIVLNIVAADIEAVHLRYMIRLHSDGSLDQSFHLDLDMIANGEFGGIDQILLQPDGKLLIVGGFTVIHGQSKVAIARLNAEDGMLDPTFAANVDPGSSPNIGSVAIQADGSILINSDLDYIVDGVPTGKVARLLQDGTLDRRFDFSPPQGPSSAGFASRLAADATGKVLMAGSFNWQYPGTQCCDSVARVLQPEQARQALLLGGGATIAEWLRDGPGPEFTRTSFEWSVDGSEWATSGAGRLIPTGTGSATAPWAIAAHAFSASDTAASAADYVTYPAGQAASFVRMMSLAGYSIALPAKGETRGTALTITATAGTPQNTVIGSPFVNSLAVRVMDDDNLPVASVPVTFTVPGSGASALLSSTTVLTNASGNAAVTAVANAQEGGYAVTASLASAGAGSEAVFRLANLVSNDLVITTTGGTPQSAPGGQAFSQPLAARLTYGNGNPVAGVAVIFSRFGESSAATATLSSTQGECLNEPPGANMRCEVVADANGEVQVIATANDQVGAYTYYAAVETPSLAFAEFHLTNTEATGVSRVVISQLYRSSLATAPYSNDYIELFNAGDGPADLTGWSVQYATGSSMTWALIDLTDVVLQPGQYYLIQGAVGTAASPPLPTPDVVTSVRLNNLTGRVALMRSGALLADANCPSNTTDLVDFFRYSGASIDACGWGTGAPTPTSVLALKRLIEGCSNHHDNSLDFTRQAPTPRNSSSPVNACQALTISAAGGTPQSTVLNAAFPTPLTVRITNEDGDPVDNVAVNFTAPGSGASAVLSSAMTTTNSAGEASVAATANGVVGSYMITAGIDGGVATFDLANTLPNATATAVGGTPQAVRVNRAFLTPLVVRVTDDGGQPIGNVAVNFTTPGSGASAALSANTVITDSNGEASITATANAWAGTYAVSATIGNAHADFVLTNTNTVVISQIHVGEGSFIELFNAGTEPQDLSGWSVQTAAAPASENWSMTSLTGIVLQPGQYYLIQDQQGGWPPLPEPDLSGATIELSTIWGRVALVGTASQLAGVCPDDQDIVDFVGFGSSTTCFWGLQAPAPGGSSTLRRENGCSTTGNNGTDFEVSSPVRRSTASPVYRCDQVGLSVSAIGGTPQSTPVQHAFAAPLTVRVTNSSGEPIGDVEVAFNARTSGSSAILSSTTAITSSNGEASVTASANQWAGSYPVTATLAAGATAQFDLTNTGTLRGPQVVISQIYPGNRFDSGSYYNNFVELFNAGDQPASLYGWSLQTSSGGSWGVVGLPGLSLQPGQRFLVDFAGYGGVLPTPDATANGMNMSSMFALVADTQPLVGSCPTSESAIVDFVGQDVGGCAWGDAVPPPSGLQALIRNQNGCAQSANNAADFSVGDPLPRNGTSPFEPCDGSNPDVSTVTVIEGAGQTAGLNRRFTVPLKVRVTNASGASLPGRTVEFLGQADGATAVLSPSAVVTDINGEASVTATANAVTGSYSVRAMVGIARADISLTNRGDVATLSIPDQQAQLYSSFRDLRVRVSAGETSDGGDQVLPDIPVQFSVSDVGGATALLSASTVVTDSNGEAVIRAVANGVAGSYTLTARIAGTALPANFALENVDSGSFTQPWDGWSSANMNLPRNRNVWIRARGFSADGSIHESVKVFYPTGGYTATPVAGERGRIEPAIPQGGDAGTVLSFSIVPDEGYGIVSVSGCGGSLNGSTYLTAPLSADCEVTASFSGGAVTHTVTSNAGPGGAIEPSGLQTVTEGETISFVLLPDAGQQTAAVTGTCGGELVDDVFTTIPVMADCSVLATFEPELIGDSIFDNGFEPETSER